MKFLYIKNCGSFIHSYVKNDKLTSNIENSDVIFLKNPLLRSLEEDQEHFKKYGTRKLINNHITQRLNGMAPDSKHVVVEKEFNLAKEVIYQKIILLDEHKAESMIFLRKKGMKNIFKFTTTHEFKVDYSRIEEYREINNYDLKIYKQAKIKYLEEIKDFTIYDKILVKAFQMIDKLRWLPRKVFRLVYKRKKILYGTVMTLPHILTTIPFLFFVKSIPLALLYGIILADTIDHGILKNPKEKTGHALLFYLSIVTILYDPILAAIGFTHLLMDWYGF